MKYLIRLNACHVTINWEPWTCKCDTWLFTYLFKTFKQIYLLYLLQVNILDECCLEDIPE